jgi:hypothetical protein
LTETGLRKQLNREDGIDAVEVINQGHPSTGAPGPQPRLDPTFVLPTIGRGDRNGCPITRSAQWRISMNDLIAGGMPPRSLKIKEGRNTRASNMDQQHRQELFGIT